MEYFSKCVLGPSLMSVVLYRLRKERRIELFATFQAKLQASDSLI
jgi:hypothetical protein